MLKPSNLYAEKVFSEHPTALWSLDDKADYISLLKELDRDMSFWQTTGGIVEKTLDIVNEPFPESTVSKITGVPGEGDLASITMISPPSIGLNDYIGFNNLNSELATFTISGSFLTNNTYLKSISLGYRYFDAQLEDYVYEMKKSNIGFSGQWLFLSETFPIPFENARMEIVVVMDYINSAEDQDSYIFYSNGISLGQWSEEFNSTSLGNVPVEIPENILGPGRLGVVAAPYGFDDSVGYYLSEDNSLLAKNSGMPMVYGADSSTILYPSKSGDPSLILPSFGCLTELGKNREYSIEMWLRINSDSENEKKIFGNLRDPSGLYVQGPFLKLRVGNVEKSYCVGIWSRPMLVTIRISPSSASLNINGESVLNLELSENAPSFIDSYSNGLDNDWFGFWAYEDIYPIEVDSVAIYPYIVADVIAKRRWVYGQGVEFPENINKSYSGTSVSMDFPFSKYTNTYSYPDLGKWNQAVLDNLSISKNKLSTPDYSQPLAFFEEEDSSDWAQRNYLAQNESSAFISLTPDSQWSGGGYILIPSLKLGSQEVRAITGNFKIKDSTLEDQVLFRIENEGTQEYLSVEIFDKRINYILKTGNIQEVLYTTLNLPESLIGEEFSVGINIPQFINRFGSRAATFLGNRAALRVYLGGTKNFEKTFTGNIYNFSMLTDRNFEKVKTLFNSSGVPVEYENVYETYNQEILYDAGFEYFGSYLDELGNRNQIDKDFWEYVIDGGNPFSFITYRLKDHKASYSINPAIIGNKVDIAISSSSYWEDYLPLSYFAKYVDDNNGDAVYALDFLQFNIDYPAPLKYLEDFSESPWTYSEMKLEYSSPTQKDYEYLSNPVATNLSTYNELKNKSSTSYSYDTSRSLVRSYISFQYLASGANLSETNFSNVVLASKNGTVTPGDNWITTKYEVVDNTIVFPPKGVDFNDLAIVFHLEIDSPNTIQNPLQIRSLELASKALNYEGPNPVGTRFGNDVYPYKKTGIYVDYKTQNPFAIYRGSSPHLYLNKNSGISLKGDFPKTSNRGVAIPINQNSADNFKVIALQLALRYDQDFFPYIPVQILEVQARKTLLRFYLVANHPGGKRARIYAINSKTGEIENGIGFYINGKRVKDANINIWEWNFLGISFANNIDFSNSPGAVRVTGPISFDSVSYYQATSLQEVQFVETRPWIDVKRSDEVILEWFYWYLDYIWDNVLVISSRDYYGVDPGKIYQAYTGTNKIIVDDLEPLRFASYQYRIHNDVLWKTSSVIPV